MIDLQGNVNNVFNNTTSISCEVKYWSGMIPVRLCY